MIKSAADFILGVWNAPEISLRVEFPLELMEEFRALVCDELQQLSRGGADPAGVLFGVSNGSVTRILGWREISRASAEEHSARAAQHDRAELVRALSAAATDPRMQRMEPLGWFVSRGQRGTGLTAPEIDLFNNFFPEAWQVTLLLRRGPGGTARAGFFVREADGFLRPDASYRELLIQPLRRVPGAPSLSAPPPPLSPLQPAAPLYPAQPLQDIPQPRVRAQNDSVVAREPIAAPVPAGADGPEMHNRVEPVIAAALPIETAAAPDTLSRNPPPASELPSVEQLIAPAIESVAETLLESTVLPAIGEPVSVAKAEPLSLKAEPLSLEIAPAEKRIEPPVAPVPETALPLEIEPMPIVPAASPPPAPSNAPDLPVMFVPVEAPAPRPTLRERVSPAVAEPALVVAPVSGKSAEPVPQEVALDEMPSFQMQAHSFGGARWLWVFPVLLALAVITFLLLQKTAPAPDASFALRIAAVGDNVEISWDPGSIPVRSGERASIQIQDGPNTKEMPLSSDELQAGKTTYSRETSDVALRMTIYATGSRQYHEFARLVAEPAPQPSPAPSPEPAPNSQLRSQRDDLETQVQQLKEQVRKEASRADQAQGVVRILENRLKVDGARNRSQSEKKK